MKNEIKEPMTREKPLFCLADDVEEAIKKVLEKWSHVSGFKKRPKGLVISYMSDGFHNAIKGVK